MNGQPHAAAGPRVEWRDEGQARQLLGAALWEPAPEAGTAPPPPNTAAEATAGSGTPPTRRRELLGACLAVVLLAVGVYAGSQAGQERRAVLQPTEPVVASQGFDVESAAADRRELRSLPREAPAGRSAAAENAAPASEQTEAKPGGATPPGGSKEEEPLLSASVPGVTTVEVSDPLPQAGSLVDDAETLLP